MTSIIQSFPPEMLAMMQNLQHNTAFIDTMTTVMGSTPLSPSVNEDTAMTTSMSLGEIDILRTLVMDRLETEVVPEERSVAPETYRVATEGEKTCVICCENLGDVVLLPCAHYGFCMKCAKEDDECPYCRRKKTHELRTYSIN